MAPDSLISGSKGSRLSRGSALTLVSAGLFLAGCGSPPPPALSVTVHYLGHSSFVLTFGDTLSVLTDYGESNAYGLDSPVHPLGELVPDLLTLSHRHADHAGGTLSPGLEPLVLSGEEILGRGAAGGADERAFHLDDLTVTAIPTYEGSVTEGPDNTSFLFEYGGLRILHLGDCQGLMVALGKDAGGAGVSSNGRGGAQSLDSRPAGGEAREAATRLIRALYPDHYDLVLLPIGFVSDILESAAEFVALVDADVIVPMHFWSPADRERFVALMDGTEGSTGRLFQGRAATGPTVRVAPGAGDGATTLVLGLIPGPWQG